MHTAFCGDFLLNSIPMHCGGFPGNDRGFEHSFCASRGHVASKGIEQICSCPGETLNAPNLCLKPPRLLNDAIYDKMTCMLYRHLFAVTIIWKKLFKI